MREVNFFFLQALSDVWLEGKWCSFFYFSPFSCFFTNIKINHFTFTMCMFSGYNAKNKAITKLEKENRGPYDQQF